MPQPPGNATLMQDATSCSSVKYWLPVSHVNVESGEVVEIDVSRYDNDNTDVVVVVVFSGGGD